MKYFSRHIKNYIFLGFIILCAGISHAQDGDGQGGTISNFSAFGFGARAMGFGNAFTAIADDPTAVYWNPAGLDYVYQRPWTWEHLPLVSPELVWGIYWKQMQIIRPMIISHLKIIAAILVMGCVYPGILLPELH